MQVDGPDGPDEANQNSPNFASGVGESVKDDKGDHFNKDLIETVKKYPGLYDIFSPDYKRGRYRHEYWSSVEMDMFKLGYVAEDTACRHVWRNIVRKYTREAMLTARATPSLPYISPWPHFESMEFFKPYLRDALEMKYETSAKSQPEELAESGQLGPSFTATVTNGCDLTLQSLLEKAKTAPKESKQSIYTGPPKQQPPTPQFYMLVSNTPQAQETSSFSARLPDQSSTPIQRNSMPSIVQDKMNGLHSQSNHLPTTSSVSGDSIFASTSAYPMEQDDAMHEVAEAESLPLEFTSDSEGMKELIAHMRGAADLVKILKRRMDAGFPSSALLNDPRNAGFVSTICGLTSQLTDVQAERFRKRVLVSCFEIFRQICTEDGELL